MKYDRKLMAELSRTMREQTGWVVRYVRENWKSAAKAAPSTEKEK